MDEFEIVQECLRRIKGKYKRRGRIEEWDDTTREEFLRAFALVPVQILPSVIDELLLNPPTDDRGRVQNWLPDPSDIVQIARKMAAGNGVTPSDVVREIMDKIRRFGQNGRQHPERRNIFLPGPPPLSPLAEQAVGAMGGWSNLCTMEAPDSVVNGLLLKHAQNAVEADQQRLILANRPQIVSPTASITREIQKLGANAIGNGGRNGKEAERG
jgi:hypothetical protein